MADEKTTTVQDDTNAVKTETVLSKTPSETETSSGSTEQKNTEGAEKKPEESEKKPDTKVEDYVFEMPKDIPYDKGILDKFTEVVKEFNLPKDQAQKLFEIGIENVKLSQEKHLQTRAEWVNNIKTDKEFGGEKFNETIARAQRVLRDPEIGSTHLTQLLESTGLGDHPELIKLLARIDKKYGEDKTVEGKPSGTKYKSVAEILYPKET